MIKKITKSIGSSIDGVLGLVSGVATGSVANQFPQYLEGYVQRHGGRLDEARTNIKAFENVADSIGIKFDSYIEMLLSTPVEGVHKTGEVISKLSQRYNYLKDSLEAITNASPITEFFVYLNNADSEIAKETWNNFSYGLKASPDAAIYAGAGLVAGYLTYKIASTALKLPFKT